jgi:hypothetical protein
MAKGHPLSEVGAAKPPVPKRHDEVVNDAPHSAFNLYRIVFLCKSFGMAMGWKAAISDMGSDPRNSTRWPRAAHVGQERGVVPAIAANPKFKRAMERLHNDQLLHHLKNGQWWFRGNKFLPENIARMLPIEKSHDTNSGGIAYRLSENCDCEICSEFKA